MSTPFQKNIKKHYTESATSQVIPDSVIYHKDGTVSVRRSYFYRSGNSAETWSAKVSADLTAHAIEYSIIESGDHFADWPAQSYFYIRLGEAAKSA